MADDEPLALIQTMNTSRKETNTALGRLTPRIARRVADPLRAERLATSRLLAILVDEIKETREFMEKFNEKAELICTQRRMIRRGIETTDRRID